MSPLYGQKLLMYTVQGFLHSSHQVDRDRALFTCLPSHSLRHWSSWDPRRASFQCFPFVHGPSLNSNPCFASGAKAVWFYLALATCNQYICMAAPSSAAGVCREWRWMGTDQFHWPATHGIRFSLSIDGIHSWSVSSTGDQPCHSKALPVSEAPYIFLAQVPQKFLLIDWWTCLIATFQHGGELRLLSNQGQATFRAGFQCFYWWCNQKSIPHHLRIGYWPNPARHSYALCLADFCQLTSCFVKFGATLGLFCDFLDIAPALMLDNGLLHRKLLIYTCTFTCHQSLVITCVPLFQGIL